MSNKIHVVIAGVAGKMGKETAKAVFNEASKMALVGAIDPKAAGVRLDDLVGIAGCEVTVSEDLEEILVSTDADVLVDFTNPQAVLQNAKVALKNGVAPIIGTTGLDPVGITELEKLASISGKAVLIVPNFALGAILMMDFAKQAARYYKNIEIIEKHHNQKIDAPSGTALKTAQMIQQNRESMKQGHPDEYEKLAGARGGDCEGVRIHSVRLPGLIAHQEVIFGAPGETLTIKHDSLHRESFMPGVILAICRVGDLHGVTVGLEKILL